MPQIQINYPVAFGVAATIAIAEGVLIAGMIRDHRIMTRKANFVIAMFEKRDIDFDEFEMIVFQSLGMLDKKSEDDVTD